MPWRISIHAGLLALISICAPPGFTASDGYALKGTLVTPTEIIEGGTIFIVGEKIQAVGKDIQLPADVKIVDTKAIIYPGLIDLHDHITWNFLPRWEAGRKFANRYEWQQLPDYFSLLSSPHGQISPSPTPPATRSADQGPRTTLVCVPSHG